MEDRGAHLVGERRVKVKAFTAKVEGDKSLSHGRKENVEELRQKLIDLKEEKKKLDAEIGELVKRRNDLNSQIKHLKTEILELRRLRDETNAEVKRLKGQKDEIKTERVQKIEEFKRLQAEIKSLLAKKPTKDASVLQKELNTIEWKIQTTPLSPQKEKQLIEKVKELEIQLNIYRKIEQLAQKKLELMAEIRALEARVKDLQDKMMNEIEKSRKIHEEIIKKLNEVKKLKTEVEDVHRLFLCARERTNTIREEIRKIAEKVALIEAEERRKSEELLLEKFTKQALEKLRRGEKLTWEEFKTLTERGLT